MNNMWVETVGSVDSTILNGGCTAIVKEEYVLISSANGNSIIKKTKDETRHYMGI